MSDRSSARTLMLAVAALVGVVFLVLAYTIVFEGCNEGGDQADQPVTAVEVMAPGARA